MTGFSPRYLAALREHLCQGSETDAEPAQRLGRRAMALGLKTLDLAQIHEQAVIELLLSSSNSSDRKAMIRRAGAFFADALTPVEKTHRTAREANARLTNLNRALKRRTKELASSNRNLKGEIVKRKGVERTLRESERNSGLLLDQSQRLQEQLRHLSRRIIVVQEEERRRISRELHDVVAQMLTGINVRLATLRTEAAANTKGLTASIARTQRLVEKSVDVVHRFARELRPAMLDDLGLIPTLHSYMTAFTKATGIRVSLTAFAGVEALGSAKRTVLYRVVQEALSNIARHAQASRGEVIIEKVSDTVRMLVKDNGKSFDVERILHSRKLRRLGLLGMRERMEMIGGHFAVDSTPGRGTTIQASIPFHKSTPSRKRS